MLNWLGISAVNPALWWGAAAIAAPILIHLLSKRKFKIVDWAAMDFLIEANRRNRRRVRLENLILLLLRCLAVLLIAALVARPFLNPSGAAAQAFHAVSQERVVLLDDSPSMSAQSGKTSLFEEAKQGLIELAREMAASQSSDTLTLLLTSTPDKPVINGQYLGAEHVEEVARRIGALEPSDLSARLDQALISLEKAIASPTGKVNRVAYIITDLRSRDWTPPHTASDRGPPAILQRLAKKADGCFLIDVGGDATDNLLITEITPLDKTLVTGVDARFQVTVMNAGEKPASDVEVKLTPGQALDQLARIESIGPGGRGSATFTVTFREPGGTPLRAELTAADVLRADNTRHFAARVLEGVPVLIVDGDPSSERGHGESFYLERALAPPGSTASGNQVEVINDSQFDELSLDKYQVIYLLNVYRLAPERVESLEAWVKAGGGLVIALGDKVDEEVFNQLFYREGHGLSPLRLTQIDGDETERKWVHLAVDDANHPALAVFTSGGPYLQAMSIFRWWGAVISGEEVAAGRANIDATLSDADNSPAIVESSFGDGRVMTLTTPLDAGWSNWPGEPSFLVTVDKINRYMVGRVSDEGNLIVGAPLRVELDPSLFEREARLTPPGGTPLPLDSVLTDAAAEAARRSVIEYDDASKVGIYSLKITRRRGGTEAILFATNLDPTEGELTRLAPVDVDRLIGDAPVRVARGRAALSLGAGGARTEIWPVLLLGLAGVLFTEQFLAWAFGRRRG